MYVCMCWLVGLNFINMLSLDVLGTISDRLGTMGSSMTTDDGSVISRYWLTNESAWKKKKFSLKPNNEYAEWSGPCPKVVCCHKNFSNHASQLGWTPISCPEEKKKKNRGLRFWCGPFVIPGVSLLAVPCSLPFRKKETCIFRVALTNWRGTLYFRCFFPPISFHPQILQSDYSASI